MHVDLTLQALTKMREFRLAYKRLRENLAAAAPVSFPNLVIRTGGGGGKGACWFDQYQFWAHPSIESAGTRYWCCYGVRHPAEYPKQAPICEVCPPRLEVSMRTSGTFAADDAGYWYYLHSGKFGGKFTPIPAGTFLRAYPGQQATVRWTGGRSRPMCVVGRLDDAAFVRDLARFVHTVAQFKAGSPSPPDFDDYVALKRAQTTADAEGVFDPQDDQDARDRRVAAIVRRWGQSQFRQSLLRAYAGQCAVTGCDAQEALEAAHILPYRGQHTNHVTNGLLLRADLHTLFDLHLIAVDSDSGQILITDDLMNTTYASLAGTGLRWPAREADRPNREALAEHKRNAGL